MAMLSESDVVQTLTASRGRIAAAAWLVARDVHAAEDISQNVVVKAMTGNCRFPSEAAALSWALVAARREAIDWLRRRRNESPALSEEILELMDREFASEPLRGGDSRGEALAECLSDMPDASRRLLILRYFEGRPCKEVAREMDLGLDAVYQRLSRLHQALRKCLETRLKKSAEVIER
jgi:RNA polymerase sigma-70 factor (ECF subfamily)